MSFKVFLLVVSCVIVFCADAMVADIHKQRQDNLQLWRLYKPQISKFSYDAMVTHDINPASQFYFKHWFIDHEKLALVKYESYVDPTTGFSSFNICRCKWEMLHFTIDRESGYVFNTIQQIVTQASPDLLPKLAFSRTAEKVRIVSSCSKYEQALNIARGSCHYSIDSLYTCVACVSDQGIIYIFKPGNELTMNIPNKCAHDVAFFFC